MCAHEQAISAERADGHNSIHTGSISTPSVFFLEELNTRSGVVQE
jgi:hypothetical protein